MRITIVPRTIMTLGDVEPGEVVQLVNSNLLVVPGYWLVCSVTNIDQEQFLVNLETGERFYSDTPIPSLPLIVLHDAQLVIAGHHV